MRVIQVNKFHYVKGGAERYYLDLSDALRRRGVAVRHLAMEHPRNRPAQDGDAFVGEVDYRGSLNPLQKIRHGLRSIHNREAARQAMATARGERPVVAHLHNIYHQLSPSVVLAFARAGVPMVQTLHDYKLVCPAYLLMTGGEICERCKGGRYYESVRHRCLLGSRGASLVGMTEAYVHRFLGTYGRIARFLCPRRFMLEKVASFGIERSRLIHLPYFLPLGEYQPGAPRTRAAGEPPVALYVGRLSREKGVATLVRAAASLPAGTVRVRILGEGPIGDEVMALARASTSGAAVEFLGYQSGSRLHDTIRDADFVVVPSEWYENLPFAILETFALGRPVLGAAIGGIPELVRNGETGCQFESGNAESLARGLLWMCGQQADLGAMGKRARKVVEEDHAEAGHLDRLLEIYRELAPAPAAGARPAGATR